MNSTGNQTWLIRYPNLTFSRPMNEAELLSLLTSGKLKPQVEICAANGHWFSLQDSQELKKHFGDIPLEGLFQKNMDEVTRNEIEITAPIKIPNAYRTIPEPVIAKKVKPIKAEPVSAPSPLLKAILIILTIAVVVLFFVWFG